MIGGGKRINVGNTYGWPDGTAEASFMVVGSSNGLVCISYRNLEFFVVNPATKEVKVLENLPGGDVLDLQIGGFGYDSATDDYKVVVGIYAHSEHKFMFQVLPLKTNKWTPLGLDATNYYSIRDNSILPNGAISCNGCLHWIFTDEEYEDSVVSYDLAKHVFDKIPIPEDFNSFQATYVLGSVDGCLSITLPRKLPQFEIWVLRSYSVADSWEKWSPPPGYDAHKTVMTYRHPSYPLGHLRIWILHDRHAYPLLVNKVERPNQILNENINLFTLSECNYNFHWPVYVQSTVSPHRMGDEGSGSGTSCESEDCGAGKEHAKQLKIVEPGKDFDEEDQSLLRLKETILQGGSLIRRYEGPNTRCEVKITYPVSEEANEEYTDSDGSGDSDSGSDGEGASKDKDSSGTSNGNSDEEEETPKKLQSGKKNPASEAAH